MSTLVRSKRKCAICGTVFLPRKAGGTPQIYCSRRCKQKGNLLRLRYHQGGTTYNPKYYDLKRILRWRHKNPKRVKEYNARARTKYKYQALAMYGGPVCICCGETGFAFLTL